MSCVASAERLCMPWLDGACTDTGGVGELNGCLEGACALSEEETALWRPLVLLIPLRLGLSDINEAYIETLKVSLLCFPCGMFSFYSSRLSILVFSMTLMSFYMVAVTERLMCTFRQNDSQNNLRQVQNSFLASLIFMQCWLEMSKLL